MIIKFINIPFCVVFLIIQYNKQYNIINKSERDVLS